MSGIIVARPDGGYRGETVRVELLLPSRDIALPGEERVLSGTGRPSAFWIILLGYLLVYGLVFFYIRHSDVNQVAGAAALVLLLGPAFLWVGRGAARKTHRPRVEEPAVSTGSGRLRLISRPNQRLLLGPESLRQVYRDDAMSRRNTPLQIHEGYDLEFRDDDGLNEDGVFDTAALYLVYPHTNDEQLLYRNVARDEREAVVSAVREALRTLV